MIGIRNKAKAKSHTHCQVAQKANRTSQNLSKSMPLPTLKTEWEIKYENTKSVNIKQRAFR